MDCTARGKGNESVEEAATRVVWVHQTVVVTITMKMEVRSGKREKERSMEFHISIKVDIRAE